ncbi:uncharacterized protein LOC132734924 isoform X2 [Ruditapes philippinarum]|uniref:uncharacterized protein LOC132734924 isoform X2 n=1 Tax=Ruditapes philippinarum TaxID=129788 RepID=UPI00295C224C|nr:uncharacterized protein LOC132734924 isoform X2 [Ruditapes philippinarum]
MSNLRKGNRPNYRKMHEGDADSDPEPENLQTQQPVKVEKKSTSVSSLLFVEENISEDDDMLQMMAELEQLEKEEIQLKKQQEKEELRIKLNKKRAEVKALKDLRYKASIRLLGKRLLQFNFLCMLICALFMFALPLLILAVVWRVFMLVAFMFNIICIACSFNYLIIELSSCIACLHIYLIIE